MLSETILEETTMADRPTEALVMDALRTVQEPDLHRDLVTLNMIRDVVIGADGAVSLTVVLTTPACPLKALIERDVVAAVTKVAGVTGVKVNMSSAVTSTQRPEDLAPGVRNIIGIASGKGGVGKSTVAANLAVALAKSGARVGLLDADIYGPNIPLMMGLVHEQPAVEKHKGPDGADIDMIVPLESLNVKVMSMGFLIDEDQPVIWRGPMLNSALRQFLGQVDWGELDYLIVDMPPGTGDVQISLVQLVKVTGIVIVTTPQDVALQDVRKGLMMFKSQNVPILGIVENMSYFECPKCGDRTRIFGEGGGEKIANTYAVPFLGEIPLTAAVRIAGDSGEPIVEGDPDSPQAQIFREVAERLAAQISIRNFGEAQAPAPVAE
jgi:ATP-binding protein involved in chromosome partitioning